MLTDGHLQGETIRHETSSISLARMLHERECIDSDEGERYPLEFHLK